MFICYYEIVCNHCCNFLHFLLCLKSAEELATVKSSGCTGDLRESRAAIVFFFFVFFCDVMVVLCLLCLLLNGRSSEKHVGVYVLMCEIDNLIGQGEAEWTICLQVLRRKKEKRLCS